MDPTAQPHHSLAVRLSRATLDYLSCPNIDPLSLHIVGHQLFAKATSGAIYVVVVASGPQADAGISLAALHRQRPSATTIKLDRYGRALRGLRTLAYWGETLGPSAKLSANGVQWRPHPDSAWRALP